jgi:hypothetical protein
MVQVNLFRGNLRLLNANPPGGNPPSTSFIWTINGGLTPINNIPQPSDWDCAAALTYDCVLTSAEYLAVEYWLNQVRRCPLLCCCHVHGSASQSFAQSSAASSAQSHLLPPAGGGGAPVLLPWSVALSVNQAGTHAPGMQVYCIVSNATAPPPPPAPPSCGYRRNWRQQRLVLRARPPASQHASQPACQPASLPACQPACGFSLLIARDSRWPMPQGCAHC